MRVISVICLHRFHVSRMSAPARIHATFQLMSPPPSKAARLIAEISCSPPSHRDRNGGGGGANYARIVARVTARRWRLRWFSGIATMTTGSDFNSDIDWRQSQFYCKVQIYNMQRGKFIWICRDTLINNGQIKPSFNGLRRKFQQPSDGSVN